MSESESREREALEQSIIDQGRRIRKEQPELWPGFLNNFWGVVLPEDNGKFISYREKEKYIGQWDKKLKEVIIPSEQSRYSELRLNQTSEEFYATIDAVIDEVDPNRKIRQLFDELKNVTRMEQRETWQKNLEELILPVYARLIAMGYKPEELRM